MAKPTPRAHKSWLPDANRSTADFPLTHLPSGAFAVEDEKDQQHLCVAIGSHLLDLHACAEAGLFPANLKTACQPPPLNALMALGSRAWAGLRRTLTTILETSSPHRKEAEAALHSIAGATLLKPLDIPNYTDFYASIHHATRVGRLFRPDNPLLPNYKYVPIGYHGRASSIVVSGAEIRRPCGQTKATDHEPVFGAARSLDYELEIGFFIGPGNSLGQSIPIAEAEQHIFGLCLVNDWSARDIQAWEYQPLGPFLAKSFATSLSPWVVTMEALAPFRTPAFARAEGDPAPLSYLYGQSDQEHGGLDLWLEVSLLSPRMREAGMAPAILGRSNFRDMYWTMAQMLTHHASNGCNLHSGDLLASGTVSGADKTARGCLLELTSRGRDPVTLPTGEQRKFLEDGDEVIIRGFCEREGFRRIGLGSCRGTILPASS